MTPKGRPTRRRIKSVAELLGPDAGPAVLRAFGFDDMLDGLSFRPHVDGENFTLGYRGPRRLSDGEADAVRAVISAIIDE